MPELLPACGAATDTGRVRENNEDRYWADPAQGLYLVADGLGGAVAGERAAELAVEAVRSAIGSTGDAKSRVRFAKRTAISTKRHARSLRKLTGTAAPTT